MSIILLLAAMLFIRYSQHFYHKMFYIFCYLVKQINNIQFFVFFFFFFLFFFWGGGDVTKCHPENSIYWWSSGLFLKGYVCTDISATILIDTCFIIPHELIEKLLHNMTVYYYGSLKKDCLQTTSNLENTFCMHDIKTCFYTMLIPVPLVCHYA